MAKQAEMNDEPLAAEPMLELPTMALSDDIGADEVAEAVERDVLQDEALLDGVPLPQLVSDDILKAAADPIEVSALEEALPRREREREEVENKNQTDRFDAVRIAVASPEEILTWSYGEVLKPETINYRTQKPERDGLFCEKIFGPVRDFECYCGKYKKVRYRGVICDKCGVEVTKSAVRRERMGHIDLAVPTAHTWYVRGIPSVLSLILDISVSDLEKVIYFAGFIVLSINETMREEMLLDLEREYAELKAAVASGQEDLSTEQLEAAFKQSKSELQGIKSLQILSESRYFDLSVKYGNLLRVGIGAEAILELLHRIDVPATITELKEEAIHAVGQNKRKTLRRLKIFQNFERAAIQPEWLILTRLPVIPPDLRPMVQLDGGRFAASDLNDLYRRVINRNNRLKRLLNQGAPEVITRNEKRMLQEAVDALIDNETRRGRSAAQTVGNRRKLRSLSDMLRGKQGRFRQNLLGKRVDYSGRSVIVVGPQLAMGECGLPKVMALELFKPFVIGRLISDGYVFNVKNATKMIEHSDNVVWDILEDITSEHYVLLNRAPTLHRLGIQAFRPILIEGKAIQIHPLVCEAFNADFDGDMMAVHVPLSKQARHEASVIMRSSHNLLKPASGEPVVSPRLDMVLGCYYLTNDKPGALGEGKSFSSGEEAIMAYENGLIDLQAKVKVKISGHGMADTASDVIETTTGRVIFNRHLPKGISFKNVVLDKKNSVKKVIAEVFEKCGVAETARIVDEVKKLGFGYAERSGTTFAISDLHVPDTKDAILQKVEHKLEQVDEQFTLGLMTDQERSQKTIQLWMSTMSQIGDDMVAQYDQNSPIYWMVMSGARGSVNQLTQMAGMQGLMVNPSGEIIELPIKSNFKTGLDEFEYFISTHGSRKGRADTALRTSEAGYLTRRLVDVSQDTIVDEPDCGTKEGTIIHTADVELVGETLQSALLGRYLAEETAGHKAGTKVSAEIADAIAASGVTSAKIRSLLACQAEFGVCQRCYGDDLATGTTVELGAVVGIVAAQAIGEPGTQLTMKTFHMGGSAASADITTGLPRVEELFEARMPRVVARLTELSGKVNITTEKDLRRIRVTAKDFERELHELPEGATVSVTDGERVKPKQILAQKVDGKNIRAQMEGTVEITGNVVVVRSLEKAAREYEVPLELDLLVKDGDAVTVGQQLTDGQWDLAQGLRLLGPEKLAAYIIREVKAIYATQGQNINHKHVEVIIRQMLSKVRILEPNDTTLTPGDTVSKQAFQTANTESKRNKGKVATAEPIVLGISRVSLKTDSFLSAASFQETTNVLLEAAIEGKVDKLRGLKENVIIGKLIPAGTGFSTRVNQPR